MHPLLQWSRTPLSRRFISIRAKLLLSLFLVIAIFGGIAIGMSYWYVARSSRSDLTRHGVFLRNLLGDQLVDMILLDDMVGINALVTQYVKDDPSILYIVVYDKNKHVVGHSFDEGLPSFLAAPPDSTATALFRDATRGLYIRQLTAPLLNGVVGYVAIGLDESKAVMNGRHMVAIAAMVLLLLSVPAGLITILFSYLITAQVRHILNALHTFMPGEPAPAIKTLFNDEFAQLADGIQDMMRRISTMTDESKKTQLKIIETEKLASVGVLASGIAHEINNPVAGIEICAYRLQKNTTLSAKNREYIELIVEAARHIQSVVKNLLNYARQPDLKEASVDLRSVIDVAVKLVHFRLERNGIKLEITRPETPCTVTAIKVQIIQVLVNGLLNAIDAIGHNGNIAIRLSDTDSGYLLAVQDSGSGLTPDVKSKAFDPFFSTKGPKGTGLGLYVSYNVIQAHGGRIELNGSPGGGACLEINLPKEVRS
jgi:signal transduction histidine kinase